MKRRIFHVAQFNNQSSQFRRITRLGSVKRIRTHPHTSHQCIFIIADGILCNGIGIFAGETCSEQTGFDGSNFYSKGLQFFCQAL